jgi:hypothetical protein
VIEGDELKLPHTVDGTLMISRREPSLTGNVFILGAGATAHAGAPMMADFSIKPALYT